MFELTSFKPKAIVQKERLFTIEEYLEMEEFSFVNHEYDNGKIIPMAGGKPNHSEIKGLAITALNVARRLAKKNFKVYNSDIRINLPMLGKTVMPDGAVVAGTPYFSITDPVGLLENPTLVVEVFSKSSMGYDEGEKFKKYKTLPSFQEYVLISQWEPLVKIYLKKDGKWIENQVAKGMDAKVYLVTLDVTLSLAEIYENVQFIEADKPRFRPKK